MGFLGAMKGLGKGVTDYATTLKEKEKQDWDAQQESVKHERSMNMQRLNNLSVDKRHTAGLLQSGKQFDDTMEYNTQTAKDTAAYRTLEQENKATEAGLTAEHRKEVLRVQEKIADGTISNQEGKLKLAKVAQKAQASQFTISTASREKMHSAGLTSAQTISFENNMGAMERIYVKGQIDEKMLSAKTAAGLQQYKDKLTFNTEQDQRATDMKMGEMHDEDYYISASPEIQSILDISLQVNGKIDMNKMMGLNADGTAASTSKFKPPTGKQLTLAMETMMKSENFQRLPPFTQLAHAATMATQWNNPGFKEKWGTKTLSDDQVVDTVKDFMDGKIDTGDISMLDLDSQAKLYEGIRTVAPDSASPRGRELFSGPSVKSTLGGLPQADDDLNIQPDYYEDQPRMPLTEAGRKNAAYMAEQRREKEARQGALAGPPMMETR